MDSSHRENGARWNPPDALRDFPEEDMGLIAELVRVFENDTKARLERLRDSLDDGDFSILRAEAHSLKGSARQMGADAVAATCQEIEAAAAARQMSLLAERIIALEEQVAETTCAMTEYCGGA